MVTDLADLVSSETVHRVVGDIDIASVAYLRAALQATMDSGTGAVVLDLTDMTFIDASGVAVLVWFATEMQAQRRRASLHGVRPMATRVLELTRADRLFSQLTPSLLPTTVGVPTW